MAKRKRLSGPALDHPESGTAARAPETKAFPLGVDTTPVRRVPIAQVAGAQAALAAAEKLAAEVNSARAQGRLVTEIALGQIAAGHILRDRIVMDDAEMAALKASIAARGQQTPIEVVETAPGAYGLISGLRRLTALRALHEETGAPEFATAKALIKPIETAPEAYMAMVEENEIRADLSFYERARLAVEAAGQGVFDSPQAAVKVLFANTTPARRSKITAFVTLHEAFGSVLRFPAAIPEKVGLALVKAREGDPEFGSDLAARLDEAAPESAEEERRVLDAALRKPAAEALREEIAPGITMEARRGRIVLTGPGVSEDLACALRAWIAGGR